MKAPRNLILAGDAVARLRELPGDSVDCVVTSPPYFRLRDYGVSGQLGQEATVEEWVENLAAVFSELARVLTPAGSVWLNVGDCYSGAASVGAPAKSLCLAPERLAIRLARDGWLCRNAAIWAKSNPMPQSAADRLSPTYEFLFLLTRSPRYFFDLDRIRVPHRSAGRRRQRPGRVPSENSGLARLKARGLAGHRLGRNPGDVWTLGKAGYRGEHSATFPAALVERPILASCPERVCSGCGRGWRRAVVRPASEKAPVRLGALTGCRCRKPLRPGLVLDPFFGTGTVGEVAARNGRDWLGIELSPRYRRLARQRLRMVAPFASPNGCGTVEARHPDANQTRRTRLRDRRPSQAAGALDAGACRRRRGHQERRPRLGARGDGA